MGSGRSKTSIRAPILCEDRMAVLRYGISRAVIREKTRDGDAGTRVSATARAAPRSTTAKREPVELPVEYHGVLVNTPTCRLWLCRFRERRSLSGLRCSSRTCRCVARCRAVPCGAVQCSVATARKSRPRRRPSRPRSSSCTLVGQTSTSQSLLRSSRTPNRSTRRRQNPNAPAQLLPASIHPCGACAAWTPACRTAPSSVASSVRRRSMSRRHFDGLSPAAAGSA